MNALPVAGLTNSSSSAQSPASQSPTTELKLQDKLVTLESLRGRLDGKKTLVVLSNAIVTPAVIDELKDQNIALVRNEAKTTTSSNAKNAAGPGESAGDLLFVLESTSTISSQLPGQVLQSHGNQLADAKRISAHINGGGQAAVWCTEKPYAASTIAATASVLKAIHIRAPEEMPSILKEVVPNVLIVECGKWDNHRVIDLLNHWRAA